ncbi:MAG TPA: hypothetical protein VFK62_08270 [Gaiellaceae bacterium]|nr:hypothetical protein [Gaiellaceae bacterium]
MSAISHEPSDAGRAKQDWSWQLPEMWASIAITSMWTSVLFVAIWGPNFVSTSSGGSSTTIPSAIVVAVFAYLGTRVVARYGFAHSRKDS